MSIEYDENSNSNSNNNVTPNQNDSQSRVEGILQAIVDSSDPTQLPSPQSRAEALLLQVLQVIEQGGGGGGSGLPIVTSSDNGKFLRVVNASWAAASVPNASGVSF